MKKFGLSLFFLIGVFCLLSTEARAIWIVGHQGPSGRCDVLGGYCKWVKFPYSIKKLEALKAGHLVLFNEEPDVDVAANVNIRVREGKMFIDILKIKGGEKFFFDVEKDMPLDPESAAILGFKSLAIKRGKYPTCYSLENPNGSAVLDVSGK